MQGAQEKKVTSAFMDKDHHEEVEWKVEGCWIYERNSNLFNNWDFSFPSKYTIWFEIVNGVPLYKYYHFFC